MTAPTPAAWTPRVYVRCPNGHYFGGLDCPFDGWTSAAVDQLHRVAQTLAPECLSLGALRRHGIAEDILDQTVLMEVGAAVPRFEALAPAGYYQNCVWTRADLLGI